MKHADDFLRAVVLKVAFKPEPLKRAQAALLYVALRGVEFTADVLPGEIIGDDIHLSGVAVGSLARIGLIQSTGFVKSPSKKRHKAWVQSWRLADGKTETAKTWLNVNGFSESVGVRQQAELFGMN